MERRAKTKCRTVVETLEDEILAGRYKSPATFPSVARIVRRFGVAHLTAVKVLDELKKMGLVRSRQGAGTFVAPTAGRSIGLIVPAWQGSDFFPALCGEVASVCQRKGRPLLFADTSRISSAGMAKRLETIAESFVEQRVSGVMFHPVDFCERAQKVNRAVVDVFRAAGVPVVLLDCDIVNPPDESGLDVVGIDNISAGWRLGEHMLSRGARRILYASVFSNVSPNAQARLAGLRDAVNANRDATLFEYGMRSNPGGRLGECLRKTKAEAIVCSNDNVAALVVKELASLGLRVPRDVLVSGVNDLTIATVVNPALTTIHQPCPDIARVAFEMLERRSADPDAPPMRVFLPAPLVMRESTDFRHQGAGACKSSKQFKRS